MKNTADEKKALRILYKKKRAALGDDTARLSLLITKNCLALPEFKEADTVLLYAAKGYEADITQILEHAVRLGKAVGFPRCIDNEHMCFHRVHTLSEFTGLFFGVREPAAELPVIEVSDMSAQTLCFVPALAYDRHGYRLGYGGGYYDRFLEGFPGTSAGITYDACMTDALPRERHDTRTDYIITESQVTRTIES